MPVVKLLASGLGAFLACAVPVNAQSTADRPVNTSIGSSNLNINPKRIVFDRLGRSATVYVFNQGSTATTFDVQLVDRLMLPDGQILPLTDVDTKPELRPLAAQLKSARPMMLVTPRRVTLEGNSGQTLRLRASSAVDVPPGEYRTHLTITALPPPTSGLTAEQAAASRGEELSFHVDSVLSLSIPVIVRVGPVDVRVGIGHTSLAFEDLAPSPGAVPVRTAVLSLDLIRAGTNSLFGDIEVRGAKERGDKPPLGSVRGIGVYPEIGQRAVKIALKRIPEKGEQIDISFRDDDLTSSKVIAKASIVASQD